LYTIHVQGLLFPDEQRLKYFEVLLKKLRDASNFSHRSNTHLGKVEMKFQIIIANEFICLIDFFEFNFHLNFRINLEFL